MSIADKYRPHYTYNEYISWEGRWELLDGMPYAMSPAPSSDHQKINGRLWAAIDRQLETNCEKCEVFLPIDWKVSENTVVQPDLVIVCPKLQKKYLDYVPALIVEILSPSTAFKDRHEKFELYEEEGVPYYLIIDPQFKKVEIYELADKKYQISNTASNQFLFLLKDGCQFSIDFDGIWP